MVQMQTRTQDVSIVDASTPEGASVWVEGVFPPDLEATLPIDRSEYLQVEIDGQDLIFTFTYIPYPPDEVVSIIEANKYAAAYTGGTAFFYPVDGEPPAGSAFENYEWARKWAEGFSRHEVAYQGKTYVVEVFYNED